MRWLVTISYIVRFECVRIRLSCCTGSGRYRLGMVSGKGTCRPLFAPLCAALRSAPFRSSGAVSSGHSWSTPPLASVLCVWQAANRSAGKRHRQGGRKFSPPFRAPSPAAGGRTLAGKWSSSSGTINEHRSTLAAPRRLWQPKKK